ncbi:hypothetical protein FSW04_24155 [Baekduia soli]|uniref:Uncharacterized protein n=1 Tax=Baekduia soli TaxID=496014 RepID=A0A5B8UCH5_9ACTN|nr:hypothetical protein [Baekduia soli]QEC50371.1 hypothetical protein FSW04_24155 [Baekduia soli]
MTEPPGTPPQDDALAEHVEDPPARGSGPLAFARMAGSSIAAPDAAPWVTDFLNAAYYRRAPGEREVEDLRLAFCILTTHWYRRDPARRLRLADVGAFHRAFGADRLSAGRSSRGTLHRDELLEGAGRLLGDDFAEAYADDARRAWGIAFPTVADRDLYDPGHRLALARLGRLTPESVPPGEQVWHTYPPVAMPSAEAVIGALTRPETWPDYASEIGRFTPLRPGGLADQTFEIEVAAGTASGRPVFTRGYVTITALVTRDDPGALARWFADLEEGLARYGDDEPPAVPEGGTPLVGFDLTTHEGHFMGDGHNRLLLYEHEGRAWVRAAGTWNPMPWHVDRAYRVAGREAQHAFWGQGADVPRSMLHQLALRLGA